MFALSISNICEEIADKIKTESSVKLVNGQLFIWLLSRSDQACVNIIGQWNTANNFCAPDDIALFLKYAALSILVQTRDSLVGLGAAIGIHIIFVSIMTLIENTHI
jgi:hypothetical protein